MSVEKRTGNEIPRPTLGKTHRSNRWARFVDLNDYADKIVDFANSTFVPVPTNPSDGDTLVYNSTSGEWEAFNNEIQSLTFKVSISRGTLTVDYLDSSILNEDNELAQITIQRVAEGLFRIDYGSLKASTRLIIVGMTSETENITVSDNEINRITVLTRDATGTFADTDGFSGKVIQVNI